MRSEGFLFYSFPVLLYNLPIYLLVRCENTRFTSDKEAVKSILKPCLESPLNGRIQGWFPGAMQIYQAGRKSCLSTASELVKRRSSGHIGRILPQQG